MTIQNAPPGLDYDRDKRFSKSFKEMIAMCLVKDQAKRPTAEKLLKHSFFKHVKPPESSLKSILAGLPPLWDRVKVLQLKDAAQLALKKMPSSEQEALSQSEYQRGVSAWNFDIDDLKAQASLIQEDDDLSDTKEEEEITNKDPTFSSLKAGKSAGIDNINQRVTNSVREESVARCSVPKDEILETNLVDSNNQGRADVSENHKMQKTSSPSVTKQDKELNYVKVEIGRKQTYSGPLMPQSMQNNTILERGHTTERNDGDNQTPEKYKRDIRKVTTNFNGQLMLPTRASGNSLSAPIRSSGGYGEFSDDKAKTNVVQIKGRFSVTSENVDLAKDIPLCTITRRSSQGSPLRKSASLGDCLVHSKPVPGGQPPKEVCSNIPASALLPSLQNLFQQTSFQQDLIMNLLNTLQQNEIADSGMASQARSLENEVVVDNATSERERLLLVEISELQARMINLTDELTAAKLKHIQLQQELNALYNQEENRRNEEIEET